MNWIELLLAAAAVLLAAAAFRRSGQGSLRQAEEIAHAAALREDLARLREGIDSLPGRIADETAASPLREAVEAVRESIMRLGESFEAHTEASRGQSEASSLALTESVNSSVSGLAAPLATLAELQGRQLEASAAQTRALEGLSGAVRASSDGAASARTETRAAILGGVDHLTERFGALAEGFRSGSESTEVLKASLAGIHSSLAALGGTWTESVAAVRSDLERLPLRFAEAAAAHPAPAQELEELAIAVREAGHLRGDVARQVAEAVSRVGQELSESAAQAKGDREAAVGSLESALGRLDDVASGIRAALEPLGDALSGHGAALAPVVQALQAAHDRLEEASGTQRANQVEFSASVDLFGRAAQELSTGLSAFAREGDKDGLEDPRQAQKALLEALERILKGFSESLRALLSESDLRTRETLAELAARLPGGEGQA